MRMMGLDYGSTTVGVAMSDALGYTSQPKETIVREKENHLRRTLAKIAELTEENLKLLERLNQNGLPITWQ